MICHTKKSLFNSNGKWREYFPLIEARLIFLYQSIGTTKFRAWLLYYVWWSTTLHNCMDIVHFKHYSSLIEARLFFLLESFVQRLRIYQSIDTTKFRAWLWYHVGWNRTLHNDMILFMSISSHGFDLGFPKNSHTNGESIF